jgi:hypothetical protein
MKVAHAFSKHARSPDVDYNDTHCGSTPAGIR